MDYVKGISMRLHNRSALTGIDESGIDRGEVNDLTCCNVECERASRLALWNEVHERKIKYVGKVDGYYLA